MHVDLGDHVLDTWAGLRALRKSILLLLPANDFELTQATFFLSVRCCRSERGLIKQSLATPNVEMKLEHCRNLVRKTII